MAAADLPPDVVGEAFVEQYYILLRTMPDLVCRFYKDDSQIGRPGDDGKMSITTTLQGINEKILSLKYGELKTDVKSVYTQRSFNGGLLVLVTGQMTGKDDKIRCFTQNFFLAPQHHGYYLLNDIFSYVEKEDQQDLDALPLDLDPELEKVQVESKTEAEDPPNRSHDSAVSSGEEEVPVAEVVEEPESTLPEELDFEEYVVVGSD